MICDTWIDEEYIDEKLAFFDNSDPDPSNTRDTIENELKGLIEREFPITKPYNIILTERKGLFLFHPLIGELKHNGVSSIKLFKLENDHEIKGLFIRNQIIFEEKSYCDTAILTDAIGQGNELDELLELFNPGAIKKVVGYIAKKEGYEKLKEKYPLIDFQFLRPVENSEYFKEHRRLQTVYQSRMERLDEEHPLGKFKIEPTIQIDELRRMIRASITPFYSGIIDFAEDSLAIATLHSFTVTFWEVSKALNEEFKIESSLLELDRVQLRFKYCQETSCLSIMGLGLPDSCTEHFKFNLYRAIFGRCNLAIPFKLCKELTPIGNTTTLKLKSFINKRKPHPFCDIYCTYCVDLNVSKYLSKYFIREFSKKISSSNFKLIPIGTFENCK